jgi:hypothetical protein
MAKMLSDNEIRLVFLLPAPADANTTPIKLDISIVALSDRPDYETLSYVWGSEPATASVQLADRAAPLSPTLHDALLRLRLPDRKRALWIDQLCINQQDLNEKMQQVQLMGDIYKSCSRCVVWMGLIRQDLRLEDADAALQFLRYMSDIQRVGRENAVLPVAVHENMEGMGKALESFGFGGNQWWHRIWTVQEAILPPTLIMQWGPLTLPWDILNDAVPTWGRVSLHDILPSKEYHFLGEIMIHCAWLYNARLGKNDVYSMVQKWRFRDATDPRDKIYGVLGVCDTGRLPETERCDYSISPARVFSTLTRELILDGKELKALTPYPRPCTSVVTPDMSSWAIDLRAIHQLDVPDIYHQMHGYDWLYRSAEGLGQINLEKIRAQSRPEVLCLEGFRIDEIAGIEKGYRKAYQFEEDFAKTESLLRPWYNLAMRGVESVSPQAQTCDDASILQYPGAGYSRKEAFLRLVVGDWIRGGSHDSDRKVTEQDLEDLWRLLGLQHSGVDHSTRQAAYRMVANQNMFATQNGLIGLGHLDVRAGDEVWIFKGGNLPFTIRPRTSEGEGGSYSFVGHCYVQGIMTGEVATRCIPWIDLVDRTVCLW